MTCMLDNPVINTSAAATYVWLVCFLVRPSHLNCLVEYVWQIHDFLQQERDYLMWNWREKVTILFLIKHFLYL